MKSTPKEVYDRLLYMARNGIVNYIPRKRSPYVLYPINREDRERLRLPRSVYEDRRERYQNRISAILAYATNDQVCRSRQLLLYFGQKDAPACGKCDYCLKKTESGLSNIEFERIWMDLCEALSSESLSVEALTDRLNHLPQKVLQVIRHQLDQGRLFADGQTLKLPENNADNNR